MRFIPQHFAPTPEIEESESVEGDEVENTTAQSENDNVATIAATPVKVSVEAQGSAPAAVENALAEEPMVSTTDDDDVELEIILPKEEDDDHHPDSQQLNLF